MPRTLPHNDEAERAILGAMLLNDEAYDRAVEARIEAADFYDPRNRVIFEAVSEIKTQNKFSLDYLTLANYLKSKELIEKAGGELYISGLTEVETIAANILYYSEIVKKLSIRRRIIGVASSMAEDAYNEAVEVEDLLDKSGSDILLLSQDEGMRGVIDMKTLLGNEMDKIRQRIDGTYVDDALLTGYSLLDKYTNGGFRGQEYIIIAARPSIGKTALGISLIREMLRNGRKIGFFSLEMPASKIMIRLLANFSRIPARNISNGELDEAAYERVQEAADILYEKDLYLVETSDLKLSDIRARARRLRREHGIECLFIDYIGLIESGLPAGTPLHEKVSYISRSLKQLARELNIPVVVLCQVSRDSEDREPILSNLRDSGSIEQDADLVMMLHRKRILDEEEKKMNCTDEDGKPTLQVTKLIVAKNRNGETGTFKIGFNAQTTSFEDISDQSVTFIEPKKPEKR